MPGDELRAEVCRENIVSPIIILNSANGFPYISGLYSLFLVSNALIEPVLQTTLRMQPNPGRGVNMSDTVHGYRFLECE